MKARYTHNRSSRNLLFNFVKNLNLLFAVLIIAAQVAESCKKINMNEVSGPVINSISPGNGPAGISVTLEGDHFGNSISNNKVYFDRELAVIQSASANRIVVTVPSHIPGVVDVYVSVNGKESRAVSFQY